MSISKKRLDEIKEFKNTDFSDCPVLTEQELSQMQPCHIGNSKYYTVKPKKQLTSIRLDAYILDYLKSKGKGWQTQLNEFLIQAHAKGLL